MKPVSIGKLFQFNRQSWPYFAVGVAGNLVSGAVMPAFSLFYAQIFAVRVHIARARAHCVSRCTRRRVIS